MSSLQQPFDLLARLLAVPSPSGAEGPYTQLVAQVLRELDYEVELDPVLPGRPNLLARPAGITEGPRVYFSTHLDVVPPHLEPHRAGDRFFGRGAADTKGPLVAMIHAAERLRREGCSAGFLLVVGEEVDHIGALKAAERYQLGPCHLLLGEPTSNRVVSAQKGLLKLTARAVGVAGHSAFPERGVSAVHRLLDFLQAVRAERWPDDPELGLCTLNVGRIEGGVAGNVFAPSASAELVFRLVAPVQEVSRRLQELLVEGVSLEVISQNDPVRLSVPPGFETCVVPFNTDASYLSKLGEVWLCGPGAIEVAHSQDEHIDLAQLEEGIEVYARLARAALAS